MSLFSRGALKAIFVRGAKPTQQNFSDLFDSCRWYDEQPPDILLNTLSGTVWDYTANGQKMKVTLTANTALTLQNTNQGKGLAILRVQQDATGGRTLSINGTSVAIGGSANQVSYVSIFDNGTGLDISVNTGITSASSSYTTADTTPPTVTARATGSTTTILNSFSENVTGTLAGWSFKKNGAALTPTAVSGSGTSQFTFTVPTLVSTDVLLCSYNSATGDCRDLAGNPLASFTDQSVTNNIGAASTQLNAPTGLTATAISSSEIDLAWTDTNTSPNESGYKVYRNTVNTFSSATLITTTAANAVSYHDTAAPAPSTLYYYWVVAAGNGTTTTDSVASTSASATTSAGAVALNFATVNNFTNTAGNWGGSVSNYNNYGLADKKLAASTDGYIQWQYVDTTGENAILAFSLNNTNKNYQTNLYHAAAYIYTGTIYRIDNGGAVTSTAVTIAVGSYLRIIRTAGVTKLQKSADAVTWTDVYTYATLNGTASNNADFFINGNTDTTFRLEQPKGYNLI